MGNINDHVAHIEMRLGELNRSSKTFGELHLHFRCLGEKIRMHDKLPFFCASCEAGKDGEWLMQPHNLFLSNGCPCCESIEGVKAKFNAAPHLAGFILSATSSFASMADVNSVRYSICSPDGITTSPLTKSAISVAIRQGRIPGETEIASLRKVKEVINRFQAVFDKNGEIVFVAWRLTNTTTPGPFFNIKTGIRKIREPVEDTAISIRGVQSLIETEISDRQKHEEWTSEAKAFGATISGYAHSLGHQVRIKYRSRTGFDKIHTIRRAGETSWGQSGYKKGEKLCQAVLLELFPDVNWKWNARYDFLLYKSSRLELDCYCETLSLALEHQGYQHFESNNAYDETMDEFEDRIKRDAFKVTQCEREAIRLITVPQLPLDPTTYLTYIQDLLIGLSIDFSTEIGAEQVSLRWSKICKNPLQKFQATFIHGLGNHKLISPELDQITARTVVNYLCGHCKQENQADANGFSSGQPRLYCPKCKGKVNGMARRSDGLAIWKGNPPDFHRT